MILSDNPTFYDLLEVAPDASSQEIRAAYLRAKSAFKKDSVALYTLIDQDETEELLARIEEAYQILSSPERRKGYDRNHGLLSSDDDFFQTASRPARNPKIVSIDRVPPMEQALDADILVPPTTHFETSIGYQPNATRHTTPAALTSGSSGRPSPVADALISEIAQETDWSGAFLKKIREARRSSLEEISEFTKISRTYLIAIETETFGKLPAAVYLRGFVAQFAKYLKLPHEKVVPAYMERWNRHQEAAQSKSLKS